jgi:hypothetical protein
LNWRTAGVLLVHPERLEPVYYGRLLHKNAFRWCSVQIHNGLAVEGGVSEAFANGWVERVRAQGIQVGGWGVNLDQPEREAAVADSWIRRYRLAHYIADAEGPHKADWPGGDPGRSARFVAKFRELQPHLPAALTTFGAAEGDNSLGSCSDDRGPFMYRPWLRAGFRLLPQAYLPTGESQAPSICYRQAAASGWPRSYVHVMVGNYDGRGRMTTSANCVRSRGSRTARRAASASSRPRRCGKRTTKRTGARSGAASCRTGGWQTPKRP